MGIRERLSGNEAAAIAMKQINPDVVAAFPITPSTEIPQYFSTFVSNGTYTESNFSIVNEYKFPTLTFMMIWNDENGEFNNIDIKIQNK